MKVPVISNSLLLIALVAFGVAAGAVLFSKRGRNAVLERQIKATADSNTVLKKAIRVTEDANRGLVRERDDALAAKQIADWQYQRSRDTLTTLRSKIKLAADTTPKVRRPGSPFAMESVQVHVSDSLPPVTVEIPTPVANVIRSCDRTLADCERARLLADSLARVERKRADNLEKQSTIKGDQVAVLDKQSTLKDERARPSRFGFGAGVLTGGALVIGLLCVFGGCH